MGANAETTSPARSASDGIAGCARTLKISATTRYPIERQRWDRRLRQNIENQRDDTLSQRLRSGLVKLLHVQIRLEQNLRRHLVTTRFALLLRQAGLQQR